jgi:ribosomal protein L40E
LSDRKYRQHGYQDRGDEKPKGGAGTGPSKPRGETYGPRQVNMAPTTNISRCAQCGAVLPAGAQGKCHKCGFELHSCKQCSSFDPGSRFECRQPITVRIARKDEMNTCTYYSMSVRIERATTSSPGANLVGNGAGGNGSSSSNSNSRDFSAGSSNRVEDARRAFDALFKK